MYPIDRLKELIRGKKVAFIGAGVSHKRCIEQFVEMGADVTLCDQKASLEEFGDYADTLRRLNVKLSLGKQYTDGFKGQDIIMRTPGYEYFKPALQQAIRDGADAIVFSAISYTKNAQAINDAASAGIKVVVIDSDVNSDGVVARIGTDNVQAGRMCAKAALETELESIVVGIVNCDVETQNGQEREQGFRAGLSGDARVQEIYTVNVPTDAELARQAARGLLLEHPDINVLAGFNEPLAVGTALAVDELELGDRVIEIAFDTNPICVELLQKGTVSALIVQNPYAMGYLGVEKAWQSLQGQRFDANTLINTTTTTITRDTMFTIESQKAIFSFD